MILAVASNSFKFLGSLPEYDNPILEYHRLLKSSSRSHFARPNHLIEVAALQYERMEVSGQKSDLDKAIAHYTEAVLLLPTPSRLIAFVLFQIAALLNVRYIKYNRQPDDLTSSIKYLRFLRMNFPSAEIFDAPSTSGDISSHLFSALALNLVLNPEEMLEDLEEMVALIPEFITADILTINRKRAIVALGSVVTSSKLATGMFQQEYTQWVFNRAIQVLREAAALNPDPWVSHALAKCLAGRFMTTLVMNDYEEALISSEKIVATCSPGTDLTELESSAIRLISDLLVSRMNSSPTPENLEDAIHRLRTFVPYSLDDHLRTELTITIDKLKNRRFKFFGVSRVTPPKTPPDPRSNDGLTTSYLGRRPGSETGSQIQEKSDRFSVFRLAIINGETAGVEAAVEGCRKLIPSESQQPSDQCSDSFKLTDAFAKILLHAYLRTEILDYLNEAITIYQGLRKNSAIPRGNHFFKMGCELQGSLGIRFKLLPSLQDFSELMQLSFELANDSSGEIFIRFDVSCFWAIGARLCRKNLSATIAYEKAMSLLEEIHAFCPTLRTQHHRIAEAWRKNENFPADYASYLIEKGLAKQGIKTLERGRAFIWSEMRLLRSSTDQLRAADPALADKLVDVNRNLESVAMSVVQSDDDDLRIGLCDHSIGHLVLTQRRLLEERDSLISQVQSLPGFENFMTPPSFNDLNSAASHGPVIIINQSSNAFPSYIILLLKDSPPSIISASSGFHDHANQLESELLHIRKEKGLDSEDYGLTLASVLSGLYELVGKPVIERLRELKVPEKSRIWWCPTGSFCSLPLHAMGPIPSDDSNDLYFSDLYIPSYTPSLSALIEAQKRGSWSDAFDNLRPSILLVAQPDTLPGAIGEITAIESTKTSVKSLISAMATPETVIEGLRDHRFAHFVCHGSLETGNPFDASLELHKAHLTLLAIVQSQLPAAEFAFLAACHTAELTEGSVADEGLHLAAAMQHCGFRSVVGTMWAMADIDGEDLSKHFYQAIFADKPDQNGVPYHERSARALQVALNKLRRKRGMTLERWVNFVHYGA